jgi:hypothetical protein
MKSAHKGLKTSKPGIELRKGRFKSCKTRMLHKRLSSKTYETNLGELVKRSPSRSLYRKLKRTHMNCLKLCQHRQSSLNQTSMSS